MSTPWERQTGEPEAAYRAFAIYRDLGPARSLRAVTTAIGTQTARRDNAAAVIVVSSSEQRESVSREAKGRRRASGRVYEWSTRYAWVERTQAWDGMLDRIAMRKTVETVEAMAIRHAKQNEQVLGVLMVPFAELAKALRDNTLQTDPVTGMSYQRNDLSNAPASELLKLALLSSRLFPPLQEAERKARGVRVLTPAATDEGTVGPAEWHVEVFQPPPRASSAETVDAVEETTDGWEIDPRRAPVQDDEDDEDGD